MKTIVSLTFLLSISTLYAQQKTPYLGASFTPSIFESTRTMVYGYTFEAGVENQQGWNFQFGFGYLTRTSKSKQPSVKYDANGILGSVSMTRRLMSSECFLSPVGGLTLGSVVYNSESEANIPESSLSKMQYAPNDSFNKMRFFATAKLQLDLMLGKVSFRFGPTYTFHEIRSITENNRYTSALMRGYGFDFAVYFALSNRYRAQGVFLPGRGFI